MTAPAWIDDYHALAEGRGAEGSGIVRLDGWSSLVASGADAGALLNNFCTNDIPKLAIRETCEAFFPNAKGKVLAFGWVWRTGEEAFRVVLGSDRAGVLVEHLDRYVIREDATLAVGEEPLALTLADNAIADDTASEASIPLPAFGDGARLLFNPTDEPPELADEAFNAWRIERGVPLDGADVDDRNLPQELGRDTTAISFTKGCYLGQETVARIDALGRVNQRLVLLKIAGEAPPAGADLIADDKTVGRVTSAAWSPEHASTIALGYVRREHAAADTPLLCGPQAAAVLG